MLSETVNTRKPSKEIILSVMAVYLLTQAPLFGEYLENVKSRDPASDFAVDGQREAAEDEDWLVMDSVHFKIYYRPEANLKSVERRLRERGAFFGRGLSSAKGYGSIENIAYQLDSLFEKAQNILDMKPRRIDLKIKIFKDRDELNAEYYTIFGRETDLPSFYVHKYGTIYTNEDDISDSVVAHEAGHAIIDHYFGIIPPAKVSELLASYVDEHLDEEEWE